MANIGIIVSVIGFVPAVLTLYIYLQRFDTLFDDRRLFLTFAVGMVMGTVTAAFHGGILSSLYDWNDLSLWIIVFVFALPLFEELFKFVVLNLKRFRGRFDTSFYGVSLGAGTGSMLVIYQGYSLFRSEPGLLDNVGVLASLFLLSLSQTLLHASTGCYIGIGSAQGSPRYTLSNAVLFHLIFNIILLPYYWWLDTIWVVAIVLSLCFGAGTTLFMTRRVLFQSLPSDVRAAVRRKERREREKV